MHGAIGVIALHCYLYTTLLSSQYTLLDLHSALSFLLSLLSHFYVLLGLLICTSSQHMTATRTVHCHLQLVTAQTVQNNAQIFSPQDIFFTVYTKFFTLHYYLYTALLSSQYTAIFALHYCLHSTLLPATCTTFFAVTGAVRYYLQTALLSSQYTTISTLFSTIFTLHYYLDIALLSSQYTTVFTLHYCLHSTAIALQPALLSSQYTTNFAVTALFTVHYYLHSTLLPTTFTVHYLTSQYTAIFTVHSTLLHC
jgi:hypothetical protein